MTEGLIAPLTEKSTHANPTMQIKLKLIPYLALKSKYKYQPESNLTEKQNLKEPY